MFKGRSLPSPGTEKKKRLRKNKQMRKKAQLVEDQVASCSFQDGSLLDNESTRKPTAPVTDSSHQDDRRQETETQEQLNGAVVSTSSPNKSHCAASAYTQAWISKFASHDAPTGSSTRTKEAITVQRRKLCRQSSTERRSPEKCPSQESSKLRQLRSDYEKLEDKCEWLKDELVKTDRRYKYLYEQYNNVQFMASVRNERHKICTHFRMAEQVSSYAVKQVEESVFSNVFFNPDCDIDNVIVPIINVKLMKVLKVGDTCQIYKAACHTVNRFAAKQYSDENYASVVNREFRVLSCINATFTPFPIGVYYKDNKPALVISFHHPTGTVYSLKDCFLDFPSHLSGRGWVKATVTFGFHLSHLFIRRFLHNNLKADNVVLDANEKGIDVILCSWKNSCRIESARILTEKQTKKLVVPEVLRREKPFSIASNIYAFGCLGILVVKYCRAYEITDYNLPALERFCLKCVSPRSAARPDVELFDEYLESFDI
ncbi:uncharacterized protein LOC135498736 isoform X2 [Lineus longissimus]|uniref:uncharacterized protein LOC135498736 isoform X2 n=1 Tax=Lineus longissimus TaxID=88925 RepID=UPI002B4C5468